MLELVPDALNALANLAQNLFQQMRFKEAVPLFDTLIERLPTAPAEIWANPRRGAADVRDASRRRGEPDTRDRARTRASRARGATSASRGRSRSTTAAPRWRCARHSRSTRPTA
jgi:hypothetical protein